MSGEGRRILVVDDNPAIHLDFRKILQRGGAASEQQLAEAAASLFDDTQKPEAYSGFALDFASQGQEGLAMVRAAIEQGRPYAVAFMDVRMPPGWDGIETAAKIWEVDPHLQIIFCTAYSDYGLDEISARLGVSHRFVILKKPFDSIEVRQLANAFTEKWRLSLETRNHLRNIEETVARRTEELRTSEERFRQVAENINEVFWLTDINRKKLIYISPAYESVWARPCENLHQSPEAWPEAVHPEDYERVRRAAATQQVSGDYDLEYRIVRPDGSLRWIHDRAFPIKDADGNVYRIAGVANDITERKRAEDELRGTRARLEHLLQSSPAIIYSVDLRGSGGIAFVSENIAKTLGHTAQEFKATPDFWARQLHPDDTSRVLSQRQSLFANGHDSVQYRFRHKDGTYRWMHDEARLIHDATGSAVEIVGSWIDITDRKRADELLKEQLELRERLAKIAINAPGVIYSFRMRPDGSSCFPYSSPMIEKIYGVPPEDLVVDASIAFERIHPEDIGHVRATIQESVRTMGPWRDEFRVQNPKIGEIWVEGHSTPEMEPDGSILWYGFLQNITERKRVEEKMRLQSSALEAAASGIVIADREGRILWVNPAFTRLTGYRAAEIVGKTPAVMKSGKHGPEFYGRIWKTILSSMVWQGEIINRRKDGSLYDEYMSITPVLDKNGKVQNFIAIKQDISERKEFEQALAYERDLLQTLMENSPDYIYFKDLNSRFLKCSKTLAQRFGLNRTEDAVGKTDFDFFGEEHARPAFEDEQEIIRTGKPVVGKVEQESWRSDGRVTWALTTKMPLRNKAGEIMGTFGISKNITELKQAEQTRQMMEVQLRQSQKLEAIGQLAAGIAHEINTPTQYVGDNTRFFKDSFESIVPLLKSHEEMVHAVQSNTLTPELIARAEQTLAAGDLPYLFEQIPAAIRETLEGVERVAKIVRAMKEFSHPGSRDKSPADLNKAIESTVTVARNEWKYVADMELDLDPALPLVPCFLGEFNQSILNLVINAAHAIGDVVKQKPGTKGRITVRTHLDGDHVEVRVTDTGTGIPEAVRSKIFEPFFTTKDVGKGTGQGLSIVYTTIVKKHGGTATFETEPGKGTAFILRLPIKAHTAEPEPARAGPPKSPESVPEEALA